MRAVIFFILLNFSTLEANISDSNFTKASNMLGKVRTTFATITEMNDSVINSISETNTPAGNSTIEHPCKIPEKCKKDRLVLTPIEDLSVPVEEANDTFGKMGKFTSSHRFRPPKKSRDNIQTATGTIDPDFDPYHFSKNYRTNPVQNVAISYSLLILIMMK